MNKPKNINTMRLIVAGGIVTFVFLYVFAPIVLLILGLLFFVGVIAAIIDNWIKEWYGQ